MIILKLKGGLGNQLFQYAYAKALQNERQDSIILDISDYKMDEKREFSLGKFSLKGIEEIDDSGQFNKIYDRRSNQLLRVLTKIMPNFMFWFLFQRGVILWDRVDYRVVPAIKCDDIYVSGYWQSEKYFMRMRETLLKEIQCDLCDKQLLDDINKSCSVCVHIRRGDYLEPKNHLQVCEREYYQNAMRYILEKLPQAAFYVFSDNIDEVISMGICDIECNNKINFVTSKHKDYEELILMSKCKHFIMSNSSFSWWSQYLCMNSEPYIIAPSIWYNDGRKTDIHMSNWTLFTPEGKLME